jgi:glycosyltransferase involved in cell wall biosynthesis
MAPDHLINSSTSEGLGLRSASKDVLAEWPIQAAPTVTVVITTFNHGRYIKDAISSALNQARPPDKIIVVDDGSTDNSASIIAKFDDVEYVRQQNRGLSAARNTGLWKCTTTFVCFLDADDRLLPCAIDAGLRCVAANPDCAMVYGGFRSISDKGLSFGDDQYRPIIGDPHLSFLRRNVIGMHGAVLYLRDRLVKIGGFDESLRRCEDYDVYLRIAQRYPVASHPAIVAEYRKHGENMSSNPIEMLHWAHSVLDRHEARILVGPLERNALNDGKARWRNYYRSEAVSAALGRWRAQPSIGTLSRELLSIGWRSPGILLRRAFGSFARQLRYALPETIVRKIRRLPFFRSGFVPIGSVRFGDFRRLSPISRDFGFDRGTPIDRYYIENFLSACSDDIRGRVLEVGDNAYTLRFGSLKVERSEILHVHAANRRVDYIGDLTQRDVLPAETFDCILLTQTLHLIFDMRAAIATLHHALKPGGTLLLTTPGISQIERGEWGPSWCWSLSPMSARRLLQERFPPDAIAIEAYGNAFAATCFLQGVAAQEVTPSELDLCDPSYPVIVTCRATKTAKHDNSP